MGMGPFYVDTASADIIQLRKMRLCGMKTALNPMVLSLSKIEGWGHSDLGEVHLKMKEETGIQQPCLRSTSMGRILLRAS